MAPGGLLFRWRGLHGGLIDRHGDFPTHIPVVWFWEAESRSIGFFVLWAVVWQLKQKHNNTWQATVSLVYTETQEQQHQVDNMKK